MNTDLSSPNFIKEIKLVVSFSVTDELSVFDRILGVALLYQYYPETCAACGGPIAQSLALTNKLDFVTAGYERHWR